MASSLTERLSRDDFRKAKELEELRKTGAAPPELDEEGRMINPHIPQYISKRPWYVADQANKAGLKHQRPQYFGKREGPSDKAWYERGVVDEAAPIKFRKGACENCGALTHKVKDCVERPRAKGAKWTGKDIRPDERVQNLGELDFDRKRDRWNGFRPEDYDSIVRTHEKAEEIRRQEKAAELDRKYAEKQARKAEKKARKAAERLKRQQELGGTEELESDDSDSDSDEEVSDQDDGVRQDADEMKGVEADIQHRDTTSRTTVRNLRLREDTAKYLINLDVNSAYYDPKTRSMRENPLPDKNPNELLYAGDNFVRASGNSQQVRDLQKFVWEANERGNEEINLIANPSQAEKMFATFKERKEQAKSEQQQKVLSKYGGSEHLAAPPKKLLLAQSEEYVEYAPDGTVVKGQEAAVPKTKYIEDQYDNNHTQVWGSFWRDGHWGYGCCKQTMRNSYCTGGAHQRAAEEMRKEMEKKLAAAAQKTTGATSEQMQIEDAADSDDDEAPASGSALQGLAFGSDGKRRKRRSDDEDDSDDDSGKDDRRKAREARRQKKKARTGNNAAGGYDAPKPGDANYDMYHTKTKSQTDYHSLEAPTEEQMDEFKRRQVHADDPMMKFLSKK